MASGLNSSRLIGAEAKDQKDHLTLVIGGFKFEVQHTKIKNRTQLREQRLASFVEQVLIHTVALARWYGRANELWNRFNDFYLRGNSVNR